ncbi:VOC family protein [Spirosoma sp. 209]|uniref:VOC family protein n=1 Tax=Spirosoma sp. 209 TaxID=1955701 RepID=UPI00098D57F2|nr:VOC family protein [Spirosoma sp. 209]
MTQSKATISQAWPYQQSPMNLPVADVDRALPFYTDTLGFQLVSRSDTPHKAATLTRDTIQIGLAENGGDPTQDGCFFAVDNLDNAFAELKTNGLPQEQPTYDYQKYGETVWKVFFVVAPDGLCYCYGEQQ